MVQNFLKFPKIIDQLVTPCHCVIVEPPLLLWNSVSFDTNFVNFLIIFEMKISKKIIDQFETLCHCVIVETTTTSME